jgi:hypothetical protein
VTPRAIAHRCAVPAAWFLLLIGVAHDVVGLSGLRRAIARGDLPERFAQVHLVNWAFSGAALSLLGLLVLLVLPGLREGDRLAWRVAATIGVFTSVLGLGGYLWSPSRPSVLVFLAFGALLAAPLLVWQREFPKA